MAVRILDGAILAVGNQFRSLVDAHSATGIHRFLLGVIMTAAALGIFPLHIPTTVGIRDNVMFFSCHVLTPYEPWGSILHTRLHQNSRPWHTLRHLSRWRANQGQWTL